MGYTLEQIARIAPDDQVIKSARSLALPEKWAEIGCGENTIWGKCKGSGKEPYKIRIELSAPAFKCSCPSRKIPCKHSIGLLLLHSNNPEKFPPGDIPDWVNEWIEGRKKQAARKAAKENKPDKPVDIEAQARREKKRQKRVAEGVETLTVFLADLVRRGMISIKSAEYNTFGDIAKRMVDAQAPGLARELQICAGLCNSGKGWETRLLRRLAGLHLLIEAYKAPDRLTETQNNDIRYLAGWTEDQQELRKQEGISDRWNVIGQVTVDEERLRVQRTWLVGEKCQQPALLLTFAVGGQPFTVLPPPGVSFEAELVFYPGSWPCRALLKDEPQKERQLLSLPAEESIKQALNNCAAARALFPWLALYPMTLGSVIPARHAGNFYLVDREQRALPLTGDFSKAWKLMSISGGHPLTISGEWDGETLAPMSCIAENEFYVF